MHILHDLRYAFRTLRRSAGLTLVIVVSLGIGIGANSAIFSVVNALLLKPLPYPDPERLVVLWLRSPGLNIPQDWPSPGQYIDVRTENHSFDIMSISQGRSGTLLGRTPAEGVEALLTSSTLFQMLGAKPFKGRLLRADEDQPGHPPVAILSHAYWTRVFGADPDIVGKSIALNVGVAAGNPKNEFEIVGVLAPDFLMNGEIMPTVSNLSRMDVFLPYPLGADAVTRRGDENFNLMARLRPGVSLAQAKADVAATAGRIRDKDKRDRTFTIDVVSLNDSVVGNVRLAVLVLLGSVSFVLLIACANVANLLLTRATRRQKEIAVRTALGASWPALVRQLLIESVMLGVLGGAAGLGVAGAALQVVRSINPGNIPRLEAISLDSRVLVFTFTVSILTGLLFGLAPALRAARVDLNSALKAGGRKTQGDGGIGTSRRKLRSLLVVAEIAISLMLLIGAGLLIRSFVALNAVSPGFDPDNIISFRLGTSARDFGGNGAAMTAYYLDLGAQLAGVAGVQSRGAVTVLPFTSSIGWGGINVEGWTPEPGQELQVDQRNATSDYFSTMRIPLRKGRFFTNADLAPNAEPVTIIDEKFAQRFWPGGDALGKHLWNDPKDKRTIVGIVGAVKQYGLDVDGRIVAYRPARLGNYQVARATGDPAALGRALIQRIHDLDPTMVVSDVQTMSERMSQSMARQRFSTTLLGAFAAFALLLAVVGVYGVMSYLVSQGAHDIGVRMALGAARSQILGMVLRQAFELTVLGVVLGLGGAFALSRVMEALLFNVGVRDAVTFTAVPLILLVTALIASYIPARRATRVDPVVALRDE